MNTTARLVILALVLGCTLGMKAYVSKTPSVPARTSFSEFPAALADYGLVGSASVDDEIQSVLKADDSMLRVYRGPDNTRVELFIAYYAVQRAGESMHSPKNCLPGSGWEPVLTDVVSLNDASAGPVINRYIIEKDGARALVLYWYEAHGRVIASEYRGKFYLVADALRSGRRDGAIVRILIPMSRSASEKQVTAEGLRFARVLRPELPKYLPE
jgi:EpsI family protein